MQIKKTQNKGLSISSQTAEILLGEDKITVTSKKDEQKKYFITTAGEYDTSGITVLALEPYPSFVIEVDGITVVYLPTSSNLSTKDNLTPYEHVDVLLLNGRQHELIEQLAPSFVIPLNEAQMLAGKIGVDLPEPQNTLSVKTPADLPEETALVYLG